jgi:hypothetical protein
MRRLQLAAMLPVTGSLDAPLDPVQETAGLRKAVEELAAKRAKRPLRAVTKATLDLALARWEECRPDVPALGARYIRALCAHAPILDDEAFLRGVRAHPELARRRRWVESLLGLYESAWRPGANADLIESLLREAIARGEAQSARVNAIRPVASRFFSPEAARWLAEDAVERRVPVQDVLAFYGVPTDSALARAVANAAVGVWADKLREHRAVTAGVRALLEYGLQGVASAPAVEPGPLMQAMGQVITWLPDDDSGALGVVRDWLLADQRFGDPRLPANQPKWAVMSATSRERMIRWLAKGDLLFFFDFVMPRDRNPHGRKEFWLEYIDLVEDSAVALSPLDIQRLRLSVTEKLRYALAESPSGEVSAFIMRFRGHTKFVVAEFSQTGNAAYIHDAELFDTLVGGMRARRYQVATTDRGLKSQRAMITKYSHIDRWQSRVHAELRELGLRRRSSR